MPTPEQTFSAPLLDMAFEAVAGIADAGVKIAANSLGGTADGISDAAGKVFGA